MSFEAESWEILGRITEARFDVPVALPDVCSLRIVSL